MGDGIPNNSKYDSYHDRCSWITYRRPAVSLSLSLGSLDERLMSPLGRHEIGTDVRVDEVSLCVLGHGEYTGS